MSSGFITKPEITYDPDFVKPLEQKIIVKALEDVEYEKSRHFMFGRETQSSVKYAWITDTGLGYVFGKTMLAPLEPQSFESYPVIKCIREYVEAYTGQSFNSVLVNKYSDGSTKLSYHHDDDPWLGNDFIVPSVSFGDKRRFLVKQKPKFVKKGEKAITMGLILESGSLTLMGNSLQKYWLHSIPLQKRNIDDKSKLTGVRYNLTFRHVYPELVRKMPKIARRGVI